MLTDQDREFLTGVHITIDDDWPVPEYHRNTFFRRSTRPVPQQPTSGIDYKAAAENWCETARGHNAERRWWKSAAISVICVMAIEAVAILGLIRGIL